jgi:hypothetical protein
MTDVRTFVSPEVYKVWGEKSWQFVSDNIMKLHSFMENFFSFHYKDKDATIDRVVVVCNNWFDPVLIKACGTTFQNRGLRTVAYINAQVAKGVKTAMLSQHVGGSTNAEDFNIVIFYKDGRTRVIPSDQVYDIIIANQGVFMAAGLTTLENKTMTKGWTHGDCRYTGLKTIYIVNP